MNFRKLRSILLLGVVASLLVACSGEPRVAANVEAALGAVPGVVSASTEFRNSAGVSSRFSVRITASPDADLYTVLDDSLRAFADASGDSKGSTSVAFYVFPEGAEEEGLRPDEVGLGVTPSVDEIRQYAAS